jgi:hypothetical protein
MRSIRVVVLVVLAAMAVASSACTNPMGPKPAGDTVASTGV